LVVVAALVGFGPGCATAESLAPAPTAEQFTGAETAVKLARQNASDQDGPAVGQHVRLAEKEITEAKERVSKGENRAAALLLARAEADADLSRVLQRRERALADAEVMEKQLTETRNSQPAAPSASAPPTEAPTGSATTNTSPSTTTNISPSATSIDRPAAERPSADKPMGNKPTGDKPAGAADRTTVPAPTAPGSSSTPVSPSPAP
jgi:hypothetical protein